MSVNVAGGGRPRPNPAILKPDRGRKLPAALTYLLAFLIILLCWQALTLIAGARIVPAPAAVLKRTVSLFVPELWKHLLASLGRVTASVVLAGVTAVPAAVIIGRNHGVRGIASPLVYLLHPVPKIALLPVIMLLFGLGNISKIGVVYLVLFFQMLISLRDAVLRIRPETELSLLSLGARRIHVLRYVVIPSLLPDIFTSLRLATGTALAVLFFAETFFARHGLGYFILDSWMRINYTDMFAGIFILSLLGLGLVSLVDLLERIFCPWMRGAITRRGISG